MTGGEAHEVKGYDALMELHDINPDRLLGDKGCDSDDIRNDLADRGIELVIPPRSNRKTPIEYDREAYKRRNLIERCVNRLKQFRRIATRYEKTVPEPISRCYLSRQQDSGLKPSTRPSTATPELIIASSSEVAVCCVSASSRSPVIRASSPGSPAADEQTNEFYCC